MNRNQKEVYCFIYDDAKKFYRATQSPNGSWNITKSGQMYPIKHNPDNLIESPIEFATNKRYFSMARSINYPLRFTFDGAAILNSVYLLGKGVNASLYFAMFEFDSVNGGIYKLSYNGRFDFQSKSRDEKLATFTVSIVDDSAWGILSQNDDVEYAIDCSENNPKTIKVLIDEFTLKNRYTFQTVAAPILHNTIENTYVIPFVLVNQDGDSFGIIAKGQTLDQTSDYVNYVKDSPDYFFYSYYQLNGINIQGSIQFTWSIQSPPSGGLYLLFRTSAGQEIIIYHDENLIVGQTYNIPINFNIDLAPGEKLFFLAQLNANAARNFTITPIVSNIFVSTLTTAESVICYGLRPLDVLKSIVQKATLERYTIDSLFFEENNKTILLPGDSIRGIRDAKLYTSFRDFFESFSALFFMALRVVNGSLFMELADEVYKQGTNIIDLGEIIEMKTTPAIDYIPNELEVGYPKQDYRHPSGRLEFNDLKTFSFPFINIKNKLSFVSKYRADSYGIIFLILDYRGLSTQDNSGDKEVFIVDILDDQATSVEDVETFENVTINNAPLAPIIKFPLTGDIINNDLPVIRGISIPGDTVNIYVEDVLDGGTVADGDGNWSYQIVTPLPSYEAGVFDGVSVINATKTDMGGALDTIQLIIDTTVSAPTGITYPKENDSLYNNLPEIRGVAPAGTNIDVRLDGTLVDSIVADNSCRFKYKFLVPIANGNHTLDIGGTLVPFSVNAFTTFPLITYFGSELDGFPVINNLPLIKGVGIPGAIVQIWLNYISYAPLGTVIVDANGDWSFQVVAITYADPLSGLPITLAPIRNGVSVISTLLINNSVKVGVIGYKLNRPAYDSITGVTDNSVFNTRLTPKRNMMRHKSILASIMDKQRSDVISYQTSDKNSNLRTVLGTEVVAERADVPGSSLGPALAVLEDAEIKVIARKNFAETLYDFNNGGTIIGTFKGNQVYFLPIGSMKLKGILDDVQSWRLLISPQTTYSNLLNLYRNGLIVNLMTNSIFHSDSNSLHAVAYDFQQPDKFNFKSVYDDWFDNRNDAWIFGNTKYIQKYQLSEVLTDQIITNGISSMTLRMYRCKNASLVDTFNYNPVNPAPIPAPEIVLEAVVELDNYPPDQYFFVAFVGDVAVYIFERIETRQKWNNTILIESNNSVNKPGVFYSTGFKTIIRVEGLIKKLQPNVETVIASEESGNTRLLWSKFSKKRIVRLGTARGFPDYLAIKAGIALTNDTCIIEGDQYNMEDGEKITPSEDIDGVPMYYYDVNMVFADNSQGKVFPGGEDADVSGVIIVLDATAIGLPAHSLIMISED